MSEVPPTEKTPDWSRLQRALMVEADRGFNDLAGHQQRFSEFLQGELSSPPEPLPEDQAGVWRSLAADYGCYGEMSFAARQYLVAETRKTIYETQKTLERAKPATRKSKSVANSRPRKRLRRPQPPPRLKATRRCWNSPSRT